MNECAHSEQKVPGRGQILTMQARKSAAILLFTQTKINPIFGRFGRVGHSIDEVANPQFRRLERPEKALRGPWWRRCKTRVGWWPGFRHGYRPVCFAGLLHVAITNSSARSWRLFTHLA
jgi:hypothetical protein